MKVVKIILFMIMATTLTLTSTNSESAFPHSKPGFFDTKPVAPKKVSRFLQQTMGRIPRLSLSCNKDVSGAVCSHFLRGGNATCCNGKCVETGFDASNCGVCAKKCGFGEVCCEGECVNVAYDERHCGFCNNMCKIDSACVYGICDYAV